MPKKTVRYAGMEIPWAARPLEKVVQQHCSTLFRLAGFMIGTTSQYRASHVADGIPDLHLFHHHLSCSGWWETKRPGELLTEDQVRWRAHCLATRTLHGWGTDEDLMPWLAELGLATLVPAFGILQRSKWPHGGTAWVPQSAELAERIWNASCLKTTPPPIGPP